MFQAYMSVFPWDLVDGGVDRVLDRLQGEVGVTGLTLWAAGPPLIELRGQAIRPRIVRSRGGPHFSLDEEHYPATRLRPAGSEFAKRRIAFAELVDRCRGRGLMVRAAICAAGLGGVLGREPELGCRNALGDRSERTLCLANPEVQALLRGLAADLSTTCELDGVTCEEVRLGLGEAEVRNLTQSHPLGKAARRLLGLCFCESCHQKGTEGGTDVAAARRAAETLIEQAIERGHSAARPGESVLPEPAILGEYERWRAGELGRVVRGLKSASRAELIVARTGTVERQELADWGSADAVIDVPGPGEEPGQPGSAPRHELGLTDDFAGAGGAEGVVTTLQRAARAGYAAIHVGNFGLLPDAALTSIKQAVRFARRETTG